MNINNISAHYRVDSVLPEQDVSAEPMHTPSAKAGGSGDVVEISQDAYDALEQAKQGPELSESVRRNYASRGLSENEITKYRNMIAQADEQENPKEYLKSLSSKDRVFVKKISSYGVLITDAHIDTMSEEGARNLMKLPDNRNRVDLNNDGVVDVGVGKTGMFPPPNAPEKVKDAWDKSVEGLSEGETMMKTMEYLMFNNIKNVRLDSDGAINKTEPFAQPGDPDYVNYFPTEESEWGAFLGEYAEYLQRNIDLAETKEQQEQGEEQLSFLHLFKDQI